MMKLSRSLSVSVAAILITFGGANAKSQKDIVVDCSLPNKSLQKEINNATAGVGTTIFVVGTCIEDVTITKDSITLSGDPEGLGAQGGDGTVDGFIHVLGADNVSIESLTVNDGMFVGDTGDVDITNSILSGGVFLNRNSVVRLNCNNLIDGGGSQALFVEEGSALRQAECAVLDRDEITGSTTVFNGSTMDLRGANVAGPIVVYGTATFRAQSSNITGDIANEANSLVGFRSSATFTGTLTCDASGVFGTRFGLDAVQCGQTCSGALALPGACGP